MLILLKWLGKIFDFNINYKSDINGKIVEYQTNPKEKTKNQIEFKKYLYYFKDHHEYSKNSWLNDKFNENRLHKDVMDDWNRGSFITDTKIENYNYVLCDDFGWYTSPNPENWPSNGTFYGFRVPKKIQNFPVKSEFREFDTVNTGLREDPPNPPVEYFHPDHNIDCSAPYYLHFQHFHPRTIEDLKRNEPTVLFIYYGGNEGFGQICGIDAEKELLLYLYENNIKIKNHDKYLVECFELSTPENEKILDFYQEFIKKYPKIDDTKFIFGMNRFKFYKVQVTSPFDRSGQKRNVYGYSCKEILDFKGYRQYKLVDQNGNCIKIDCSNIVSYKEVTKFQDLLPAKGEH